MYSVYILTVPDGRRYIGTTSMPVKQRWNHGNGYRFCSELWNIICELGWDAINKEVVGESFTEDEASNLEQTLISTYQTTNPSFGFNREAGGLRSEKVILTESKAKMSSSHQGERNFNFGKHFSEEHRRKIAESNSGQKRSAETRRNIGISKSKAVSQYTLSGVYLATYDSGRIAEAITGVPAYSISKACRGIQAQAEGYIWKFTNN